MSPRFRSIALPPMYALTTVAFSAVLLALPTIVGADSRPVPPQVLPEPNWPPDGWRLPFAGTLLSTAIIIAGIRFSRRLGLQGIFWQRRWLPC